MRRRIFILVVVVLFTTGALDEQDIWCEEAIAHLLECCPDLNAPNVCGSGDCRPVTTLPRGEAECLLELECGPEAEAACERIEAVQGFLDDGIEDPSEDVCR